MSGLVWVPSGLENGYRTCLSYGPASGERDRSEAAVRRLLQARKRRLRSHLEIVIEDTGSEICGRLLLPAVQDGEV